MIVERSTQDIEDETVQLFNDCKPYLDQGMGFYAAIRKVKGLRTSSNFGNSSWYKRFKAYAKSQGYKPLR